MCLNVLNIERTFVDKIMSIKRHSICGTIKNKVRHIYDVTRLFELPDIQKFLENKNELKRILKITTATDMFYFNKRKIVNLYNPIEQYNFSEWKHYLDSEVAKVYENMHKDLLYTNEKQSFSQALLTLEKLDSIFRGIDE